jgi:hypothetical protein
MKNLLFVLPLVVSLVTVAAQKKEGSIESAASEQHVAFNPDDLKWGDVPPGLPPGAKMAVLAGDPTKKGAVYRATAGTCRLQGAATHSSDC